MAKTLQAILGYVSLAKAIEAIRNGVPNALPAAFMTPTDKVIGDSGRFTRLVGERRTARLSQYGASAVARELKTLGTVDVKLIHSIERQTIPPLTMQQLRNFNDYNNMRLGMEEVARQTKLFTTLFQNLRIATTAMVLANQTLYFDGSGNLLPSSTGQVETVSFQMNANNQNQLNGVISTSWASAVADIPSQIRNLRVQAAKLTGYPLRYAFYGKNVPSYLTNNDYVLDYLARDQGRRGTFLGSAELGDLFDLQWIPVYEMFFADQNNTNQEIFGADQVIFTPEPSDQWWKVMEGSFIVPTTINIVTDAAAALASSKQVYGMGGYGFAVPDPPSMATVFFDTFLPVLANPDALFSAVVKF